jgi:hypothetical protein
MMMIVVVVVMMVIGDGDRFLTTLSCKVVFDCVRNQYSLSLRNYFLFDELFGVSRHYM